MTFHALYHLMCRWVVPFKAATRFRETDQMSNRAYALILPKKHKGRPALCPVRSARVGAGLVVDYQRQLYEYWGPEADEEEAASDTDDGSVEEIVVDDDDDVQGEGRRAARSAGSRRRSRSTWRTTRGPRAWTRGPRRPRGGYGKNVVEVRVPGFLELYREQLLSPIAMFQVFTSLLWLLDAYWQYVGFTLFSIVTMEAGTARRPRRTPRGGLPRRSGRRVDRAAPPPARAQVMQRRKTLQSLSGMSARAAPVLCLRDGQWQDVSSDELLPGDLISIARRRPPPLPAESPPPSPQSAEEARKRADARREFEKKRNAHFRAQPSIIPCDCVLVQGSAVTNEATLTGESTPQMKDALDAAEDRALAFEGADRVATLFSGTDLVNSTPGDGPHAPPDGGAVAYVLRTGFSSAQGELMQMIEFSQQGVSSDTFETLLALGILLLFALASAAYVFREGLRKGDRTTHELLLRCVIIVTSVVPRQLPMQMALAVNTALMALMKRGIMAVEPYRVPFAGRLEHCLFDKTGTLTTDRLVPAGVVGPAGGALRPSPAPPRPPSSSRPATRSWQAATTTAASGGDPIELTAVRALGWTYDPKAETARGPRTAARIRRRFHFSSALQRMSVVADVDGVATALVKGSPEAVGALLRQAPAWFEPAYVGPPAGLRVLALASRRCDGDVERRDDVERDLERAAWRPSSARRADSRVVVTALAQSAHRVAMVTGDAPLTALHVARECNIADGRPALVLGPAAAARGGRAGAARPSRSRRRTSRRRARPLVVTEKALRAAAAAADDEAVWRAVAGGVHASRACRPRARPDLPVAAGAARRALRPHVRRRRQRRGRPEAGRRRPGAPAGYGDANTTGQGGYADAGAKLAAAKGDSSAEAVLNAQKEALEDAHRDAGQRRKAGIDAAQKDMAAKQKEWLEEEIRRREQRGETGFLAQAGAIKDVALRMKREMEVEVRKIDRGLGNVYDEQLGGEAPKDPMAAAQKLLGGLDDPNGPQMIRPGDASVAAPFTSRAPSIRAVVDLIRQGRCTLLSSLQQQQIMVLESVISAYTLAALSLEGARSSERQMMASGWRAGRVPRDADPAPPPAHTARSARRLLVVASLAFSYATPLESMHPIRPLGSLFHPSICAGPRGNPREREREREARAAGRAPRGSSAAQAPAWRARAPSTSTACGGPSRWRPRAWATRPCGPWCGSSARRGPASSPTTPATRTTPSRSSRRCGPRRSCRTC